MRCTKCKKRISSNSKFCPDCGGAVSVEQKKKKIGCFSIILIIFAISIIGTLVSFIFSTNSKLKMAESLSSVQGNLADITSAKLAGNSIISGKKVIGFSLESIKSTTETASQNLTNLSTPSLLQDYQRVVIIWANKIALATKNTKTWKNLANQPGDFPLTLETNQAQTFFKSSIKSIAELKQAGSDAIKNKDKQAMRLVVAKLLIQKHWLNGILYSTNPDTTVFNLIPSVFAQGIPNIQGVDVTCQVCSDPKIKWTKQLRAQYGCDTKCKPQQQQTGDTQTPQTQDEQNDTNNFSAEDIKELESFTYKGIPKRAICIGTGGLSIGGSMTNVFCVEDAVTTITEIAFSAIGFSDGTKVLSIVQWEKGYEEIDDILASKPSVEGGHLLEGMGVIGTSEPDKAPAPVKKTTEKNKWDGDYSVHTQLQNTNEAGCADFIDQKLSVENGIVMMRNWQSQVPIYSPINASGQAWLEMVVPGGGGGKDVYNFQFYSSGNKALLKGISNLTWFGIPGNKIILAYNCNFTITGSRH